MARMQKVEAAVGEADFLAAATPDRDPVLELRQRENFRTTPLKILMMQRLNDVIGEGDGGADLTDGNARSDVGQTGGLDP